MKNSEQKNLLTLVVLPLALGLQACGGASSTLDSGDPRVTWQNKAINLVGGTSGTSAITLNQLLTLSATINVPSAGLGADDIYMRGSTAYVSYNTTGTPLSGAIDQITINALTGLPTRNGTYTNSTSHINGVYVDAVGTLYATGNDNNTGSLLYQMSVTAGGVFNALTSTVQLPSFAGTAVKVWGSSLYALSGNAGGLNIFAPGSQVSTTTPGTSIYDARGMDQNGASNLWVITGANTSPTPAAQLLEITSAGAIANTYSYIGGNNVAQSKSSVKVGTTVVAASLGAGGVAMVCLTDHNKILTLPMPTNSGLSASVTPSNSVTFGSGLMFVANGEAGVYVYQIVNPLTTLLNGVLAGTTTACGNIGLSYLGYMDLGSATHYSANGLYLSGNTLFVATGAGGFKVITVNLSILSLLGGLLNSI